MGIKKAPAMHGCSFYAYYHTDLQKCLFLTEIYMFPDFLTGLRPFKLPHQQGETVQWTVTPQRGRQGY